VGNLDSARLPVNTDLRPGLRGRRGECAALDRLVAETRAGHSQVLVLRGEAGVGKTVLLEYLPGHSPGCRVARAAGVESEAGFPFAGLHQLCAPFLDRLGQLPGPQRDALESAFGLSDGDAPDRFLVGLAVLSLLADAAQQQPLICLIDDAQWLDQASAQTLTFAARRLLAEPVALVFAAREATAALDLAGLPELVIQGLSDTDARLLLKAAIHGPLDPAVLDRIIAETRGNPQALLELPRGLTPAEIAGGFGLPGTPDAPGQLEQSLQRLLTPLPPKTRLLLLVVAAEPVGDPVLVWRAAGRLGIEAGAAAPAAAAGLIEPGGQLRFRHPLLRSAVYRAASPGERHSVHRALADATDASTDADRRAWHRAQATPGLDEKVAAELECSAGLARSRGGLAAAAAFHTRAVELTPDPRWRAQRALAAARSEDEAGAPGTALMLLALAGTGPLDEPELAYAELLRAQITLTVDRSPEAVTMFLSAARRLEPLDPALTRTAYRDAFCAAMFSGGPAHGGGLREIAEAVLTAGWGQTGKQAPRAWDLLLDGLAMMITQGYAPAAQTLKRGLSAFRAEPMPDEDALRWLWLACYAAQALGDDASWEDLTDRQVQLARDLGALSVLPIALCERFSVDLFTGGLTAATALATEIEAVIEATGSHLAPQGTMTLAAWRGHEAEVCALIDASGRGGAERDGGLWLVGTAWVSAVLLNGLGRYEEVLAVADHQRELGFSTWILPELIEAAVRSGNPERAASALFRLAGVACASGTEWMLGIESRSRALLAEGEAAERLYQEAIKRLSRTRMRLELARAHLLYGEWLRRERRRVDAREQLRAAHEMLIAVGAAGFAERARRELMATGETVRKQTVETRDELTPQEAQIARLAAHGRTNPEIGAELFISARTVEWHLRKVYAKLGVGSRRQLRLALPGAARAAMPV
jgi:DNA-binding CsgD family transcriptional regulator